MQEIVEGRQTLDAAVEEARANIGREFKSFD
jgi:hypothetical protein